MIWWFGPAVVDMVVDVESARIRATRQYGTGSRGIGLVIGTRPDRDR